MPPGKVIVSDTLVETFTTLLTQSFVLGIRAAAPTMTALLLATLVLALLSRTLPQLNVMAVGFGFSSLVTLGTLSVSLGIAAWAFQEQTEPTLELLLNACTLRAPSPQFRVPSLWQKKPATSRKTPRRIAASRRARKDRLRRARIWLPRCCCLDRCWC